MATHQVSLCQLRVMFVLRVGASRLVSLGCPGPRARAGMTSLKVARPFAITDFPVFLCGTSQ